jgi:hypothetical protein
MEIHRRLADDPYTEEPRLRFFSSCQNIVKQIAGIPLSKTNSEDVDTKAEDHAYDALRYGMMTRMSGYTSNSTQSRTKFTKSKTKYSDTRWQRKKTQHR